MDRTEDIKVTRQDLLRTDLVDAHIKGLRTYGLSDVGLANICADWDIPRSAPRVLGEEAKRQESDQEKADAHRGG